MTLEDYELLTDSMAEVLSLDSKKKNLEGDLKNQEKKLANDKKRYELLKEDLQGLKKKLESNYKGDTEYYQKRIKSCKEKINFYKAQIDKLAGELSVRPTEEEIEPYSTEEYVGLAAAWTILTILMAVILSYDFPLAHLVTTDLGECTDDAIVDDNDVYTWDSMEECKHQKTVMQGSVLFVCIVIPVLTIITTRFIRYPARLRNMKLRDSLYVLDAEEAPSKIKLENSKRNLRKWERNFSNAKNHLHTLNETIPDKSSLLAKQEKQMLKSESIVESTKNDIESAKANIQSNLNSVSHLVPYNENLS